MDRKARRDLGRAIVSFQEAAAVVRAKKARRRRTMGVRPVMPVLAVGGVGALAMNEGLRQKVVGLVSGSSNGSEPTGQSDSATSSSGGETERTAARRMPRQRHRKARSSRRRAG